MMKKNDENSLKDRLNEEPAEEKTTVSESNAAAPSESDPIALASSTET